MSSPINVVKTERHRISQVPINPATTFNSGDMMKWDPINLVATPIVAGDAASATAAALFIGVSNDTNPITSLKQTLPDNRCCIITSALVLLTADDNATYYPGDAVTFGADPQKFRHTGLSATNIIGYVAPENGFTVTSGASVGIAATAGVTQLLINLRPQFVGLTD